MAKSRNQENLHPSRDDESRAEVTWTPPQALEAPPARDGFRQRWVRTQIQGEDTPHHTMMRFREGWTPRPMDTVPDDFPIPSMNYGKFTDVVGIDGMILCELPEAKAQARERYFSGKRSDQDQFVGQALNRTERAGGLAIDRESNSGVDHGRQVADD